MSLMTKHLQLIKPEIDDEIEQSIADLADNFQKLDDVAEIYASSPPTSGHWGKATRIWNADPVKGGYIGWVNVRDGIAASRWKLKTQYSTGDIVVPNSDNGHYYECTSAGTSGVLEPNFPVSSGGNIEDRRGSSVWDAATSYNIDDIIIPPTQNGYYYLCITAGTSDNSPPTFSTIEGNHVVDGSVVWEVHKIVVWTEKGVPSLFRGFGLIEG